jgi:hypothetical protein
VDLNHLFEVADKARAREKLTPKDVALIRRVAPEELGSLRRFAWPARVRHPGGFTVTGAPVGTFARSALLVAGGRVLGQRYGESAFYTSVERDLAFGIMRSHFHHGDPKGTFCCTQCTLAVLPVLEANAIRYFDCGKLAKAVRQVIVGRQWRFATRPPQAMLEWSLLRSG